MLVSISLIIILLLFGAVSSFIANASAAGNNFIFAAISDSHTESANYTNTLNQINTLNPDLIIHTGDSEDNGVVSSELNASVTVLKNSGVFNKTFLVRGNHDDHITGSASLWQTYFSTAPNIKTLPAGVTNYVGMDVSSTYLTYSFDYGNSRFIGVDSPGDVDLITSAQYTFMNNRLTEAENLGLAHAFIYFHGPEYCVTDVHCRCTSRTDASCTPAEFITLINNHPIVSATFHGHEHVLGHVHLDNTRLSGLTHPYEQIFNSAAGGPYDFNVYPNRIDDNYTSNDIPSFALVEVNGYSFTVKLYRTGNTTPLWTSTFSKPEPTPTRTPSATITPSPTITATMTLTPSPTLTLTPTKTDTPTPSATSTPANVAPVAVNDSFAVEKNKTIILDPPGVLGDDSDEDSDELTIIKVSNPGYGSLILNSNGSFTYIPAVDYVGDDSFTYQAYDGNLYSNTATVTIHVLDVTPPILPSSFYGEIYISDNPPAAGNFVEANVPGISGAIARAAITAGSPLTYSFDVPGDIASTTAVEGGTEGGLVTFKISGRVVGTTAWHTGTHVQVNFHPPQPVPGGPYSGSSGVPIAFSGSANDWGSDVSTYQWDWDHDGTYDTTGQAPSHAFSTLGSKLVGLKVTDGQGGEGTTTLTVNISNPSYSIVLAAGWNLVSFPLQPTSTTITDVLNSLAGNYSLVYAWKAANGSWMKYDPNVPYGATLTALDESMGFWIKMIVADSLDISGSQPGITNIALKTGWNLVGYPSISNQVLPDGFSLHGVGTDFTLSYSFHAVESADQWKKYDLTAPAYTNDLLQLSPDFGYWIKVGGPHTWDVSY